MKKKILVIAAVMLLSAGALRAQTAVGEASTALRDGQTVESTGLPISPEYRGLGESGILRFGVGTKDGTVPCYQEGTNTALLEEIHRRLENVVAWNGRHLLQGKDPAPIVVTGAYDARAGALIPAEIRIPRLGDTPEGESFAYDRYRPDRGDALLRNVPSRAPEVFPLPEEHAVPPTSLDTGVLPPADASVGTEGGRTQPWRDYPSVTYQQPYTYHIEMPPSVGYSQDSVYYNSSYGAWGYRSEDGFGYSYPAAIPLHDSEGLLNPVGDSGAVPEAGDGGMVEEDGGAENDRRKPFVGSPLDLPDTGSDARKAPTGRAERWGRARQINRKFNNPSQNR